ncbi:MAG: flavin reductase family protein [Kiritimatiellae bacterium]|jgi:flavin reductase (DIM6/NTAB) family NADH-FMN oxidoreductase RutF|nr:flavin reductase family protein [Kiritimatiellia bacterium]
MNRAPIDIVEKASDILRALRRGVLVTSKANGRANSMVVEWGTLGFNWGKPVFVCYVRESRFTRELLDANAEFTVNLPVGPFDRRIIAVCGSRSGRDMDKAAELGLTLVDGEKVSVPAVAQLPLTLECRVIYRQKENNVLLPPEIRARFYPSIERSHDTDKDDHIIYFGEIVAAYLLG